MNPKRKRGFTLIELLVVIVIILILAGLILPVLHRVREQARAVQCLSNIRQLGLGMLLFAHDDPRSQVPIWSWEYDECDNACWATPSAAQLTCFVRCGYVWRYASTEAVYVCPVNPDGRDPGYPHLNPVWGYLPQWSYVVNGQPDLSTYGGSNWRIDPTRVRPSTASVMMLMEQSNQDVYA